MQAQIAPRFTLHLPMRYRPAGDTRWRPSMTENLSSSGVRFVASETLTAGTKIEVEISMTAAFLSPTRVVTVSEVIRQGSDDEPRMTSIRHLEYRMESDDPDVKEFARTAQSNR